MNASLDGNAIAGTMLDVFGRDMTADVGTCGQCGWTAPLAAVAVYSAGYSAGHPGVVARCPECEHLLMVIVQRRGTACVDVSGFSSLQAPGPARA
jgi:uncharacterized protein DUF6510